MMRLNAGLAVMLLMPIVAQAQRLTPSGVGRPAQLAPGLSVAAIGPPTRLIPRLHRYMNWGTAGGAAAGALIGFVTFPNDDARGSAIMVEAMIGAAVGNLGGLIVGLADKQGTDTLPELIPSAELRSPNPFMAYRLRSATRYVGLGGRIGASIGFLGGLATEPRVLTVPMGALGGFVVGMTAGAITYVVQR